MALLVGPESAGTAGGAVLASMTTAAAAAPMGELPQTGTSLLLGIAALAMLGMGRALRSMASVRRSTSA